MSKRFFFSLDQIVSTDLNTFEYPSFIIFYLPHPLPEKVQKFPGQLTILSMYHGLKGQTVKKAHIIKNQICPQDTTLS